MSVDRDEVERIAALARLKLRADEIDRLTDEMNRIFSYATELGAGSDPAGADPASEGPGPDGGEGAAVPAPSSVRLAGASSRDPLRRALADFGPIVTDGFFLVPNPPGVVRPDGGES